MLKGKPIYVSDSIKNPDKYIRKINNGNLTLGCFIIALAGDPQQLEIIPGYVFGQKYFKDKEYEIVGIAAHLDDAYKLVLQMTQDALDATGDCLIKPYLATR